MEAPERGALMLVRFVAAALVGWTVVDLALYWLVSQHNHTSFSALGCVFKSIPAVLGIGMFIKARALAEWISNKLDE